MNTYSCNRIGERKSIELHRMCVVDAFFAVGYAKGAVSCFSAFIQQIVENAAKLK